MIAAQDWPGALGALDEMRKLDPTYQTSQVDGMYYFALRNYGYDLIVKQGNLEGGIYQFTLAERFGPLDRDTNGIARRRALLYPRRILLGIELGTGFILFQSSLWRMAQPMGWHDDRLRPLSMLPPCAMEMSYLEMKIIAMRSTNMRTLKKWQPWIKLRRKTTEKHISAVSLQQPPRCWKLPL